MAYCSECGGEISQGASYCRHCGTSLTNVLANTDSSPRPTQKGGGFRRIMKWGGIGCGGLIGLIVILIIIGSIIVATDENEDSNERAAPASTDRVGATAGVPSRTPSATPTQTPIPTATPIPTPIKVRLAELLGEYDQNPVRANARLRYQENGKTPVSTSGYVSQVKEFYVSITPTRDDYSFQELNCYYADIRAALQMTKGQFVSATGRVSGTDGSSELNMFACEFDAIQLQANTIVSTEQVRRNVVQVFCLSGSIFSSSYKGTGVIINAEEGIILTVHHVVADENECETIEVELPGTESRTPATIVKHCASIDRARLRVSPQVLRNLSLQSIHKASAPAQIDQDIYFWGYGPGALRMETGIVKDARGEDIVTDAYAVPGDSGSPVFDENGHLLGTMSRSNRSDRAVFTGDECQ